MPILNLYSPPPSKPPDATRPKAPIKHTRLLSRPHKKGQLGVNVAPEHTGISKVFMGQNKQNSFVLFV